MDVKDRLAGKLWRAQIEQLMLGRNVHRWALEGGCSDKGSLAARYRCIHCRKLYAAVHKDKLTCPMGYDAVALTHNAYTALD